ESDQFLGDVSHIPRREELALFNVNCTTRFRSGTQQISLPAEECRYLQHVDLLAGNLGLSGGMDIGCDRNLQLASDLRENVATFAHFFFSSRRRHTRWPRDWSSDVCSSDLDRGDGAPG